MKKALIVLLLLAVVAGGVFAQGFTIQGRMDALWVPFQYIDKDGDSMMAAGLGRDNGAGVGPRARLMGSATNEEGTLGLRIGLQFFPQTSGGAIAFDDNVDVWWKPFDMLTLDVGKYVNDTLRGKVGDHWFRKFTVGNYNPDAIFTRFASGGVDIGSVGATGVLGLFQIGDLTLGINFPGLNPFGQSGSGNVIYGAGKGGGGFGQNAIYEAAGVNGFNTGLGEFKHVYQRTQVALGYNIADVGLARVQFVGANPALSDADPDTSGYQLPGLDDMVTTSVIGPRIEAAFALTMVENLTLDIGGKFVLPQTEASLNQAWGWTNYPTVNDPASDLAWEEDEDLINAGTYKAPVQVGVGAIYTLDALTITGRVDLNFMGGVELDPIVAGAVSVTNTFKRGMEINAHIWPTYDLGFMVLGLDFGIAYLGDSTLTTDTTFGGKTESEDTTVAGGLQVGGGLFLSKTIGTCTIRSGLAYAVGTKIGDDGGTPATDFKSDGVFTLPVLFEYTF